MEMMLKRRDSEICHPADRGSLCLRVLIFGKFEWSGALTAIASHNVKHLICYNHQSMHRPAVRNARRKPSQEPKPLLPQQQKKANIKTRMQSKVEAPKDSRKPIRFANQTNLPTHDPLYSKENISRSEEDTRDDSESDLQRVSEEGSLMTRNGETVPRMGRSCQELQAYCQQIREYVLEREQKYMIEHGYLRNHHILNLRMRSYLVRHIFRISHKHDLLRTTTYLAVHYMDLYFSRVFNFRDQFQTVAVAQTCLFIAMKYEEIYPPELCQWVDHRYKHEILRFEADILRVLDYQLAHYTLEHFIHFQLWESTPNDAPHPPALSQRTMLLMDLTLFDLPMRQFKPSQLAKLLQVMSKKGPLDPIEAQKQDRQMAQQITWMIERNGEALKYLIDHKYHGVDTKFN